MPAKASTPKKPAARKPAARRRSAKPAAEVSAAAVRPKSSAPVKRTYIFAVGRRKEAVARVRLHVEGAGEIVINTHPIEKYFPLKEHQQLIRSPLVLVHQESAGRISAKVAGGGSQGQAEAVRLGVSRALVKQDPDLRIPLKRAGFLRRDPRVKERKKYGLKRARRAPQWQKR